MNSIINILESATKKAFSDCGYDSKYGVLTISKRPDLCEYQCNGAMAAAKEMKTAPINIANAVVEKLTDCKYFEGVEAVMPGFINLKISGEALADYISEMASTEKYGLNQPENPLTIVVDYGGPNVAKPLHVGHLRAAIIGESCKRIFRYMGHKVIGDVHLGDWGLQIGLIITELKTLKPELCYFDDSYTGDYPEEAPFTMSELEQIYPAASAKSKEDEAFKAEALAATHDLQAGRRGYRALWQHIISISVADIKKNYERLSVDFDVWGKESDAQPYIPDMVNDMKENGIAYYDEGALIVDIKKDTDTKEIPPCIILKSDASSLYTTTDLATLVERRKLYDPDKVLYVVDKRQDMHFEQVFRTALKAGIVKEDTNLQFLGFGTMNGKDGKPYKTRTGGIPRLENLIDEINEEMLKKINENKTLDEDEAKKAAEIIGLSAIKYGDLSNQATKNYIFDPERFTSFEGNTGPYILYTIVRIKSILRKFYAENGESAEIKILPAVNASQKNLMLSLTRFAGVIEQAADENAPHKICAYIYELSNAFNRFYHETKILSEEDTKQKASFIGLLSLTKGILEDCIDMLGFSAPERM